MHEHDLTRGTGQRVRVTALVYNDAQNDSRVLKEARSLQDAGAEVTLLAISNTAAGRGAGEVEVAGVPTRRLPQFEADRFLPAPLLRALRRRVGPATRPAAQTSAPSGSPGPTASPAPLSRRARAVLADLSLRAFGTVKLGTWWADLVPAILRSRPDVIHAHDANSLVPAMIGAQLTGAALVYDSHELWRHRNVRPDRWLAPSLDALVETIGIRAADAVITVSPSIVSWLQGTYSLPRPPALVRNVPVAAQRPQRRDGRLRELAGLDQDARVIAYGGRITTSRGLEETFAALTHLPADVHLVMLGYGEESYLRALEQLARDLGVQERVHRVGPVAPAEVSAALADGDVAVVHVRPSCLSYRFSLPNKLFESIRGGLPVAAADLPDIRQVVTELGVGEMFAGEEPQDLAATVLDVLADPGPYREAAARAAADLVWEREAAVLLDVYAQVLGARAR